MCVGPTLLALTTQLVLAQLVLKAQNPCESHHQPGSTHTTAHSGSNIHEHHIVAGMFSCTAQPHPDLLNQQWGHQHADTSYAGSTQHCPQCNPTVWPVA